MTKVFIDGRAGTTGLKIDIRLSGREDIQQIILSENERKNPAAREAALNECDIAFLCLPDAAARESVALIRNADVKVIDASTAHRTQADWAYGFPELSSEHTANVRTSKRVAVPGCHASGFIALVYPLISNGLLPADALLSCYSLTGYSGGGKGMIADYESADRPHEFFAPRQYALGQEHKHLKEMTYVTELENAPVFCPIVDDYYAGMLVSIPLFAAQLNGNFGFADIRDCYRSYYDGDLVRFTESLENEGMASANQLAGKDIMRITVSGNSERMLLMAQFDNLGKGASGAAIQCMNLMLGLDPATGLVL